MSERKHPPPPAPTTRSSIATHNEASGSTPGNNRVAPSTLDNILANLRSETVGLIDTAIERSQATTHELVMSQFERFNAALEHRRGQPPQQPTDDGHPYNRSDRDTTHVYEPDPYTFDGEHPRRGQFYDGSLSRSLRIQAPVFTTEITFSELRRDYINFLRGINSAFPDLLEEASPHAVVVNTTCQSFQKKPEGVL
jgi:hypothetical protein